jgi:phasin family protein
MTKLAVACFEDVVAPVVEINKIALSYTEKLVKLNLAVTRKQADVALAGWRAALSVKDAAEAKDYLTAQGEAARGVVEGFLDDAKAVSLINQEVADDVRKVVTESIEKASKPDA